MRVFVDGRIHDLGYIAIPRKEIVEALVLLQLLRARGALMAFPIDHRDLLLLAWGQRKAVEEIS